MGPERWQTQKGGTIRHYLINLILYMQIVQKNDDGSEVVLFDSATVTPPAPATITEVDVQESDGSTEKFVPQQ